MANIITGYLAAGCLAFIPQLLLYQYAGPHLRLKTVSWKTTWRSEVVTGFG
jgi:hypothetical protein